MLHNQRISAKDRISVNISDIKERIDAYRDDLALSIQKRGNRRWQRQRQFKGLEPFSMLPAQANTS